MIGANYWEKGSKHQWVFYAKDNSSLEGLSEKINPDELLCSDDSQVNLGIKRLNGRLYSSNYVGVCRLKSVSGKNIAAFDGCEVVLKIEPRFPVSVVDMLNALREDDEFERYLAPQTNRINDSTREIEDLGDNELFHFFYDEDPIFLQDSIARESSIITASVFLTMLKSLCSRPLMGRMVRYEENFVGKAKGKIIFRKNIRTNTLRGRDDRIYCSYLQYSEDILENQVLKAALHKAEVFINKYLGSASAEKNSFREIVAFCRKAMAHITYTSVSRLDLKKIKTTGVYVYYKPVINAAKMVLNEITLEANGESAVTSYVVPYAISMEKLFEIYVRAYLKRAGVSSYNSDDNSIRLSKYDDKTAVLRNKGKAYSTYIGGNIKPDIIVYDPETENYIVFDVKYKDSLNSRYARPDRMQILAYGLMMGCDNVGIIFPTSDATNNMYYMRNEINSNETRTRYFNQLEIAIDTDWKFEIVPQNGEPPIGVMEYIKLLLSNKPRTTKTEGLARQKYAENL